MDLLGKPLQSFDQKEIHYFKRYGMNIFEERLKGGHPNSLGNTVEIVEEVLSRPELFDALFQCYFSTDEVVRLRVSNAMKRICAENQPLLVPYINAFLNEIALIDQASTQWTLSQLFLTLEKEMDKTQREKALMIMKNNLEQHSDWIVLNQTMKTLGLWSKKDEGLKAWLIPHLHKLETDNRNSVSKGATKWLKVLST